ncbi:hypothetical protein O0L34_g9594 [Tuta absoluta]|nr:hypothetical protein O0L34_g9594 [Tuta absoluta]
MFPPENIPPVTVQPETSQSQQYTSPTPSKFLPKTNYSKSVCKNVDNILNSTKEQVTIKTPTDETKNSKSQDLQGHLHFYTAYTSDSPQSMFLVAYDERGLNSVFHCTQGYTCGEATGHDIEVGGVTKIDYVEGVPLHVPKNQILECCPSLKKYCSK